MRTVQCTDVFRCTGAHYANLIYRWHTKERRVNQCVLGKKGPTRRKKNRLNQKLTWVDTMLVARTDFRKMSRKFFNRSNSNIAGKFICYLMHGSCLYYMPQLRQWANGTMDSIHTPHWSHSKNDQKNYSFVDGTRKIWPLFFRIFIKLMQQLEIHYFYGVKQSAFKHSSARVTLTFSTHRDEMCLNINFIQFTA